MPSEKVLQEKAKLVESLSEKLQNSTAGVIVNYTGITVAQDTALRTALRKAGVEYKVYKNTLSERALEKVGYGALKEHLVGMTAIATSENDPVAPAKILKEYAEKVETFDIKGGFVNGDVLDRAQVLALAEIPSFEGLIAKMLGSLQSPLYGLAYVLQAKIDKENGAAEA